MLSELRHLPLQAALARVIMHTRPGPSRGRMTQRAAPATRTDEGASPQKPQPRGCSPPCGRARTEALRTAGNSPLSHPHAAVHPHGVVHAGTGGRDPIVTACEDGSGGAIGGDADRLALAPGVVGDAAGGAAARARFRGGSDVLAAHGQGGGGADEADGVAADGAGQRGHGVPLGEERGAVQRRSRRHLPGSASPLTCGRRAPRSGESWDGPGSAWPGEGCPGSRIRLAAARLHPARSVAEAGESSQDP